MEGYSWCPEQGVMVDSGLHFLSVTENNSPSMALSLNGSIV